MTGAALEVHATAAILAAEGVAVDAHIADVAVNGLTQEWAKSLRREGVRVNSLCMGATDSHMQRSFYGFDEASPPPPELLATWMDPDELGRTLVELLLEGPTGRSGDNIGLWRGHPTVLPPPSPTLAVPADFDPADMVGAGVEPVEAR